MCYHLDCFVKEIKTIAHEWMSLWAPENKRVFFFSYL